LTQALSDIKLNEKMPWIETQVITSSKCIELTPQETQDDLKRELAFYAQAIECARLGQKKVLAAGVTFFRPSDYFAEMIKTDQHMTRVRQKLLDEAQAIKASEQAKKQRENKKFGKKVQIEKQLERSKQKKLEKEKIGLLRRRVKDGGSINDDDKDDFDIDIDHSKDTKKNTNSNKNSSKSSSFSGGVGKNSKRKYKDSKFGFGGPKRNRKSNTAESTNDDGGYSVKKMKQPFAGIKKKKTVNNNRPGKSRRQKSRK